MSRKCQRSGLVVLIVRPGASERFLTVRAFGKDTPVVSRRVSRRSALIALAGACFGCSKERTEPPASRTPPVPSARSTGESSSAEGGAKPKLSGRILAFGTDGTASVLEKSFAKRKTRRQPEKWSVFIDVDLATGAFRTSPVPVTLGHIPVDIGRGRILCVADGGKHSLVLDRKSHEVVHVLENESDYDYSGHAVVVDGRAYVPLRKTDGEKHEGLLEVVDLESYGVLDTVKTGGFLPHDAKLMPDGKEVVVSHYGHWGDHFSKPPYYWNIRETSLTFLDSKTLELKRKFEVPLDQALTHFDIGGDGLIYVGLLQYVRMGAPGLEALLDELGGDRAALPSLRPSEYRRRLYALPSPIVVFDPKKGQIKRLTLAPGHQRRNQSVVTHSKSGNVFGVFTHSDNLIRVSPGTHALRSLSAFDMGLFELRGVCDLPGTSYIAANGQDHGIAIVDANTLEVVQRLDVPLYNTVHLHWVPA